MRRPTLTLLLLALLAPGCVAPQPAAFRHPHFRPGTIRRPAVVLQVALDPTGLPREGASSPRERSTIPEAFELAFLEHEVEWAEEVRAARLAAEMALRSISPPSPRCFFVTRRHVLRCF